MNNEPKDPKPGTPEASRAGCLCPVLDNSHGRGRYCDGKKYGWWVDAACPIHKKEHCPRRLMGEDVAPHMPCDTGDFSRDK